MPVGAPGRVAGARPPAPAGPTAAAAALPASASTTGLTERLLLNERCRATRKCRRHARRWSRVRSATEAGRPGTAHPPPRAQPALHPRLAAPPAMCLDLNLAKGWGIRYCRLFVAATIGRALRSAFALTRKETPDAQSAVRYLLLKDVIASIIPNCFRASVLAANWHCGRSVDASKASSSLDATRLSEYPSALKFLVKCCERGRKATERAELLRRQPSGSEAQPAPPSR